MTTTDPEARFDVSLTLSADTDYVGMVRDLALHAAKVTGCADARAAAFGRQCEEAVREAVKAAGHAGAVAVTVRRTSGPIEIVIGAGSTARTFTLET